MVQLEYNQIQGIILSGYGHLRFNSYLFLQFGEPGPVRQWLTQLCSEVTTAAPWEKNPDGSKIRPATCTNIAFTSEGLARLDVSQDGFITEFKEGIIGALPGQDPAKPTSRSIRLGDTGQSAPANWELGGPKNEPLHAMLMLFAGSPDDLNSLRERHLTALGQAGIKVVMVQDAQRPEHNREPFGFMDGLSQPTVEGTLIGTATADHQPIIKAGEFVLGYENEYNLFPPQPDQPELARNGTYLVYRKLEQDIAAFWNFVYQVANADPQEAEFIGAKMVGRWRSGAPMILAPDEDNPDLGSDPDKSNDFIFTKDDKLGYGCPIASHVRRTNPRDSLLPTPEASLTSVRRHRILRRGRVYGPAYDQDVVKTLTEVAQSHNSKVFIPDTDSPRGLAQILINADLKRQFEFIQQSWVNDPKFDGLFDDRDPIIGNNGDDPATSYNMAIGRRPVRRQLQKIPRFVNVKGGAYMFLPGMAGLRFIANRV